MDMSQSVNLGQGMSMMVLAVQSSSVSMLIIYYVAI